MDVIEAYARVSVARGSAFAVLAVLCVMLGLLGTPAFALRIGGFLFLVISLVLMLRAEYAHKRSYKHTEVWLMLDDRDRPPTPIAQQVICSILRNTFNEFSLYFARTAAIALASGLVLELFVPSTF